MVRAKGGYAEGGGRACALVEEEWKPLTEGMSVPSWFVSERGSRNRWAIIGRPGPGARPLPFLLPNVHGGFEISKLSQHQKLEKKVRQNGRLGAHALVR